jgi:hypothetical protein
VGEDDVRVINAILQTDIDNAAAALKGARKVFLIVHEQLIEAVRNRIHWATRFNANGELEWSETPQVVLADLVRLIVTEEGNVVVVPPAEPVPEPVPETVVNTPEDNVGHHLSVLAHLSGNVTVTDTDGCIYHVRSLREVHTDHLYMLCCYYTDDNGSFWVGGGKKPGRSRTNCRIKMPAHRR